MPRPRPRVRVHQLNLWCDPAGLPERLACAAAEIAARRPDVLTVQEVLHHDGGDTAADLAALTGMQVAASGQAYTNRFGHRCGEAVLTRLPVHDHGVHALAPDPADTGTGHHTLPWACLAAPSGRHLHVLSAHLPWGGANEPARLDHAHRLDTAASVLAAMHGHADVVTVAGLDANAAPDAVTLRWLTGRDVHPVHATGAFWVDAWEHAGDGPGATSVPDNPWAARTAAAVGILDPSLLPARRIDHVLVHGWVHGRAGHPLAARRVYDTPGRIASDHYGLEADLWDPPRP